MAALRFATLDVFTETRFTGNPLAIVLGADRLSTEEMQTIAAEFNLSETIFVMRPEDAANTAKVRIFTPAQELPFAGHPTIGCAIYLAEEAQSGGDFRMTITLEEEAGLVPVLVNRHHKRIHATLTAPVLPQPVGTAPETAMIARSLGLAEADIGVDGHEPGAFVGGPSFLYVPVVDRAALSRARPAEPFWSDMLGGDVPHEIYVYTSGAGGDGPDCHARMFAPTMGIPEDPATGSATALFAGQLLANGALPEGTTQLHIVQGEDMGRASALTLEADVTDGVLSAVRVGGSAVRVSEGRIATAQA